MSRFKLWHYSSESDECLSYLKYTGEIITLLFSGMLKQVKAGYLLHFKSELPKIIIFKVVFISKILVGLNAYFINLN